MKNKKMTYLLIGLVMLVWGIIIYRLFSTVNQDNDTSFVGQVIVKEAYNDFSVRKDTSHLLLNYRDPFGLTVKDMVEKKIVTPMREKLINTISKPIINWTIVKYLGYIRNPDSKKLIAIMSINGKTIMLSEGESAEQVRMIKNLRDSVKINYKGQTKFISQITAP